MLIKRNQGGIFKEYQSLTLQQVDMRRIDLIDDLGIDESNERGRRLRPVASGKREA
ncbi:MAG: hypothetical protein KJ645_01560 [Planctomycetes bacterium]|nr:hypothetical protein [Planctomycetota bacterium]